MNNMFENDRFIRSVKFNRRIPKDSYLNSLPAVKNLEEKDIEFNSPVTFFCGENGTGKSTLLEAIAVNYGFNAEGGSINISFSTKETHSDLYKHINLVKGVRRAKTGFFLRAESFYNVATEIDRLDEIVAPSPKISGGYGGKSLHVQSHGESFMSMVQNRLGGNGLYIFDEPESALSPNRQMTLLCEIDRLVKNNCQLIIATHSPILLSYPNAEIYELTDNEIKKILYEETQIYAVTKEFLNNYKKMLKILLEDK